jgi:hypothetical protein
VIGSWPSARIAVTAAALSDSMPPITELTNTVTIDALAAYFAVRQTSKPPFRGLMLSLGLVREDASPSVVAGSLLMRLM